MSSHPWGPDGFKIVNFVIVCVFFIFFVWGTVYIFGRADFDFQALADVNYDRRSEEKFEPVPIKTRYHPPL